MSKTPIMILQEAMIKQGIVPLYEEISSTVNGSEHVFTVRVKCKNTVAEGVGSNKKQAKQNAATTMLTLLNIIPKNAVPLPQPVSTTVNNHQMSNEFTNYVGKLNEYCAIRNIPNPVYEIANVAGPSHLPIITISCAVSDVRKEASASSKMAAKHNAAKKVLEVFVKDMSSFNIESQKSEVEMEDMLKNLDVHLLNLKISEPKSFENPQLNNVIGLYKMKTKALFTAEDSSMITNYHVRMKVQCEIIWKGNQKKLICMQSMNSLKSMKEFEATISQTIKTTIDEIHFKTKQQGYYMHGFKLNAKPTILQIGFGRTQEEAKLRAFNNLLKYIYVLQK